MMTRKMLLIAGVAGLALTSPVTAERGGRDKAQEAAAQQGGGQQAQRQTKREERQAQRPQRQERQVQVQRAERPQMQRVERAQRVERPQMQRIERPQRAERQVQRIERQRPQRVERQQQRIERQQQRLERRAQRPERIERQRPERIERQTQRIERQQQRIERQAQRQAQRIDRREQRVERTADRRIAERIFGSRAENRGPIRAARFDGRGYRPVTPLTVSREMRPMAPFRAKFDDNRLLSIGERYDTSRTLSLVPAIYGTRYVDTNDYYYRYDNDLGYVYQIDRDDLLVRSAIPLFGGYGIGDPWPATYYSSYVPLGYRDYYYDTPDYYYRTDGYGIYQVDGTTQLITALVALLTGQGFGIGQALPASYGAYNVPLAYRSSYYDTNDSWYRYGDGFIYQVDPGSRVVAARYPLYADDYYVGDPWPVAYPDYNVPDGYQSLYYDTPQYHYRYANGGIYQVDPTNQVILALVALLSGNQFGVGQPMPAGYDIYNVPFDYRDRYADSDREWYRYANGYVYRVDADSGLIEEAIPVYA